MIVVVFLPREKGLNCRMSGIEDKIAIARSYRRLAMSHSMLVWILKIGSVDSSGNDVRSGDLSGLWRIGLRMV